MIEVKPEQNAWAFFLSILKIVVISLPINVTIFYG